MKLQKPPRRCWPVAAREGGPDKMVAARPVATIAALSEAADRFWAAMEESDWLEAFASHPRIGERATASAFEQASSWSQEEQSGISSACHHTSACRRQCFLRAAIRFRLHCLTDIDSRCGDLKAEAAPGSYRLTFNTGVYLKALGQNTIYPEILTKFDCDGASNYHPPLLLSDNGSATYQGS